VFHKRKQKVLHDFLFSKADRSDMPLDRARYCLGGLLVKPFSTGERSRHFFAGLIGQPNPPLIKIKSYLRTRPLADRRGPATPRAGRAPEATLLPPRPLRTQIPSAEVGGSARLLQRLLH
jgi:hypothetical protein